MRPFTTMKRFFSVAITIVAVAMAPPGVAEEAVGAKKIEVAPQQLSSALQDFSEQSGLQVAYVATLADNVNSKGTHDAGTAEAALSEILDSTGLEYQFVNTDTVAIGPAFAANNEAADPGNAQRAPSRMVLMAQASETRQVQPTSTASPANSDSRTAGRDFPIEEIVVTAQRREERLQSVPISISVIRGEELDRSTAQGMTEILSGVPGVTTNVSPQGGGTLVTVRGVTAGAPLFDGSNPIAYYLDTVPFGLVDSAIAPDTNAFDLARVEVLRGPQGTLYGANALNGVVRVLTNGADLNAFQFKARTSASSTQDGDSSYRGDMALNVPIVPGRFAARFALGHQDFGGWIDRPNGDNANNSRLSSARLRLNAQPTDRLSMGFSAWASRQDINAPSIANDEGRTFHLVDESTSIDYDSFGLSIDYDFETFVITSMTSYLDYRNNGRLDYADFFGFSTPLTQTLDASVVSQEFNISSIGTGPWRWTAGSIYRDSSNETVQALPDFPTFPPLDWTNASKSYAVFGELTRRFADGEFELTLGLRYFQDEVSVDEDQLAPPVNPPNYYHAEESFNATTPRVVLTWHPSDRTMIYGSYSEGFRSGAPQAYFLSGTAFTATEPDELQNYEIGTKAAVVDGRVMVEAAVYYMDWTGVHQILSVPLAGVCCVSALVNGPPAQGLGFDLGLSVLPFDGLELGLSASWNDLSYARDVTSGGDVAFSKGDRLNFSPEYTIGGSANYSFPLGASGYEGRIGASANYTSEQLWRLPGAPRIVGDSILRSRASFSVRAPEHWEIALFADNIGNEDGRVYSNPLDLNLANPATAARIRPRTIGLQLDYRY